MEKLYYETIALQTLCVESISVRKEYNSPEGREEKNPSLRYLVLLRSKPVAATSLADV